jgi:hypothetical protein
MLLWLPLIFTSALFEIAASPATNTPTAIWFEQPTAP